VVYRICATDPSGLEATPDRMNSVNFGQRRRREMCTTLAISCWRFAEGNVAAVIIINT
jgi:hypothetical protein